MAEVIAIAVAKGLAELVAARMVDEVNLDWGLKDKLQNLNKKFEYIQAFLEDAGNSKYATKSRLVNLWVQKVKNVAYLADDVMDEYAIEIFRRKMELKSQFRKNFRNLFTPSNPVLFHFQMAHKVKEILSLFDEIDKDAKDIGLNLVDIAANAVTDTYNYDDHLGQTRQHATVNASEFVGREDDLEKLLKFICSPCNEVRDVITIAVVGMGGLSKTTLARRVYDHERISAYFGNNKIWICVSQKFEITKLLNEIVESVTSSTSELSNTDAIIRKLQEELKGKKFLLVLDDVWNDKEDSWDYLKGLLHRIGTAPGSVVLVTTRNDEVAKAAGAVFKHKLKGLSEDESWSLLQQIVFNHTTRPNYFCLEEVGRRIVEKCKGVPLAIKVIGGLLQSKQQLYEWESIEKSEMWGLPHSQNQILPSLLLSFNHLPSFLKQCFAYCAIFLKDRYVYKTELIGLWLSQGYLRSYKRNLTAEEIGEEYMKILISNSLLQEDESEGVDGQLGYRMHDLVYDLAVYVSGNEMILEPKSLREESICRHLAFDSGEDSNALHYLGEEALTKLRTFQFINNVSWNMLVHAKHLRTLFLDSTGIKEVTPAIELLRHLRYLDLSYNPISTLPESIGKLYQLQTLILKGCRFMKKLPKVVNELVNLRHISTTAPMFACYGLQQLTNLQSLPCLSLDNNGDGWTIDELGDLRQLRDEIHILGLDCVKDKEQARKAGLASKPKVTKLILSWVDGTGKTNGGIRGEDVLEGLEPHPNITSLEVESFNGEKFPTWIMRMAVLTVGQRRTQLNNLTEIKLLNCNRCKTLPTLGQLPFLKRLILSGLDVECIGVEFYGSDNLQTSEGLSFQSLIELEIFGFKKLNTWMVPQQVTFPCLEIIRIRNCNLLETIPAFGTKSLLSLELIDLDSVEFLDIITYGTSLTFLVMNMLPKIKSLPQELGSCRKLQELHISNFKELKSLKCLNIGLASLESLRTLEVSHCKNLTCLPDDLLRGISSLHILDIVGCPKLRTITTDWEGGTSLKSLTILKCPLFKVSPTYIRKLPHLRELKISCSSAEHLRSVLEAAQYLPLLWSLGIAGFKNDKDMREYFSDMTPFLRLPSLTVLMLLGHQFIKTLPQQLGLLTRITDLYIWDFNYLEEIPDWIGNLSSLDSLILEDCNSLKYLPSKEILKRLPKLRFLKIAGCPQLAERYAKDDGPQWHNISHISCINIIDTY